MINDILISLIGVKSELFRETEEGFVVQESLVSTTEIPIYNKIGQISYLYSILKGFCDKYSEDSLARILGSDSETSSDTVFLHPVKEALASFLEDYREEVVALEREYLQTNIMTGTTIINRLAEHNKLMDCAYIFLRSVFKTRLRGKEVLQLLYDRLSSGDSTVRSFFTGAFIQAFRLILSWTTNWVISGELPESDEFFISRRESTMVKEKNNKLAFNLAKKEEIEDWRSNYFINYENIPYFLNKELCESILFIGKSIKVLNSTQNTDEDRINYDEILKFNTILSNLEVEIFDYTAKIPVNVVKLDKLVNAIEEIKRIISKFLMKSIVVTNDFFSHLRAVKDIFFTFKGEFFYELINALKNRLSMPFSKDFEVELNKKVVQPLFSYFKMNSIYSGMRLKLLFSGYFYALTAENVQSLVQSEGLILSGAVKGQSVSNRILYYANKGRGALWNRNVQNLDDSFKFTLETALKLEKMQYSAVMNKFKNSSSPSKTVVKLSFILQLANSFETRNGYFPQSTEELTNFIEISVKISIDAEGNPQNLVFSGFYVDKTNEIDLTESETKATKINKNEILLFEVESRESLGFFSPEIKNRVTVEYASNYVRLSDSTNVLCLEGFLPLEKLVKKENRLFYTGVFLFGEGELTLQLAEFSLEGETSAVGSNRSSLVDIDYTVRWPHRLVFNESVLRQYSNVFRLVFPLKFVLVTLNDLWIRKKKLPLNFNDYLRQTHFVHHKISRVFENLVSFLVFEVIDCCFREVELKMSRVTDFEELIALHEDFIKKVVELTFVGDRKIMSCLSKLTVCAEKYAKGCESFLNCYDKGDEVDCGRLNELAVKIIGEFDEKLGELFVGLSRTKSNKHAMLISRLLENLEN